MKTVVFGLLLSVLASQPSYLPRRSASPVSRAAFNRMHEVASVKRLTCDASDLCESVGYVIVTCSNVVGDFEGADFGKSVSLDNGMIFTFNEYKYTYSYRPDAVVLAHNVTFQGTQHVVYKLLIEDETYEVTRVR